MVVLISVNELVRLAMPPPLTAEFPSTVTPSVQSAVVENAAAITARHAVGDG
jgi:hypothetical protein